MGRKRERESRFWRLQTNEERWHAFEGYGEMRKGNTQKNTLDKTPFMAILTRKNTIDPGKYIVEYHSCVHIDPVKYIKIHDNIYRGKCYMQSSYFHLIPKCDMDFKIIIESKFNNNSS
jgi:hypothetical protein